MPSLLDKIAAAVPKAKEGEQETFPIPRWDKFGFSVSVTYKLVDDDVIEKLTKGLQKKDKELRRKASLQFHVDTAVKITFNDLATSESVSYDGFGDAELGELLLPDVEEEFRSAQKAVNALFIGEGDAASVGRAVIDWSGYKDYDLDEETLGE